METEQTSQQMAMQAYYSAVRDESRKLLEAYQTLLAFQAQWISLDYTNALEPGQGTHNGLTKTEISAVVNTTRDAIEALMALGHGTNLYKLL